MFFLLYGNGKYIMDKSQDGRSQSTIGHYIFYHAASYTYTLTLFEDIRRIGVCPSLIDYWYPIFRIFYVRFRRLRI